MKKVLLATLVLILVLAVVIPAAAQTGNGAPNGAHYNLNIIGVPKGKTADMTGNNGHRIFVPLGKDGVTAGTKIYLIESEEPDEFAVLDANGTDGRAEFMLPLPAECYATVDPVTGDITTPASCTVSYTVWARALGKPGGQAWMKTCVEDIDLPGGYLCSVGEYILELERKNGRSQFDNVTEELLFVSANFDLDPAIEHIQIFDPLFDTYYWQYDNQGLKLLQLRFYMGDYTITW
jgi:hypothetical protein